MKKLKRVPLSDQARRAIQASGIPQCHVAEQLGIGEAHLSRFLAGYVGLGMEVLDQLGDLLDLQLVVGPHAATAKDYPDRRRKEMK